MVSSLQQDRSRARRPPATATTTTTKKNYNDYSDDKDINDSIDDNDDNEDHRCWTQEFIFVIGGETRVPSRERPEMAVVDSKTTLKGCPVS
jgi:hypothetical protein